MHIKNSNTKKLQNDQWVLEKGLKETKSFSIICKNMAGVSYLSHWYRWDQYMMIKLCFNKESWSTLNFSCVFFRKNTYQSLKFLEQQTGHTWSILCHWSFVIPPKNIEKALVFWVLSRYRKRVVSGNGSNDNVTVI